jgi:hypothetical protein
MKSFYWIIVIVGLAVFIGYQITQFPMNKDTKVDKDTVAPQRIEFPSPVENSTKPNPEGQKAVKEDWIENSTKPNPESNQMENGYKNVIECGHHDGNGGCNPYEDKKLKSPYFQHKCKSYPSGRTEHIFILSGYSCGKYYHAQYKEFADRVAIFLKDIGYRFEEITVGGFSDSHSTSGVCDWADVEDSCKKNIRGKLNNYDLAYVRQCLIKKAIENRLKAIISRWRIVGLEPTEFKETSEQGPKYRRVEIKIITANFEMEIDCK